MLLHFIEIADGLQNKKMLKDHQMGKAEDQNGRGAVVK